jgi:hypothetical protein
MTGRWITSGCLSRTAVLPKLTALQLSLFLNQDFAQARRSNHQPQDFGA